MHFMNVNSEQTTYGKVLFMRRCTEKMAASTWLHSAAVIHGVAFSKHFKRLFWVSLILRTIIQCKNKLSFNQIDETERICVLRIRALDDSHQ